MTLDRGDIDQEEIDGARRFKRGAIVLVIVLLAALIWRFI